MNGLKKLAKGFKGKYKTKNLIISIVILIEVISLLTVATFAWVETVSSIKITNETNTVGTIKNDTKYTDMMIGGEGGTIDLLDYFESSGDMHLAPASSADGKNLYFPKANIGSNVIYRKGNVSDKNTTYLSASFRLKADTNADFFFTATPAISVSNDIRVSVTAYTEGENPEGTFDPESGKLISNTKIYANNASTTAVVNSTSGATGATTVEAFSDHQKGAKSEKRLFAVGANETKYVTINVWLQKSTDNDGDLTSNMSVAQAINNLGITSSLTPRHVTLLPTPTWDSDGATFYAWCWTPNSNQKSRLYKLELNSEEEHYTFDYNGTYTKTTFVRAVPGCTVKPGEYDSWPFTLSTNSSDHDNSKYWNQTVDTSIPNDPVDPTYIIKTINGGTDSKSTGEWKDPATVKVAYVTDQDSDWGTLTATSYIGSATSSHVIESTNSSSDKHTDTVHAWPGKILQLKATAKTGYAFVGWYLDAAGTTPATTVNSTAYTDTEYKPNAPSTASEITYYAKFKETRTLTIVRTVDGNQANSVAAGTITVNGSSTTNTGTSKSVTVDKGSRVTFSAAAEPGYTFHGFYTAATDGSEVTSPLDPINTNTTYYARFKTNSYDVNTRPCSTATTGGTSFYLNNTGGTVKTGTGTQTSGSTTTSTQSVKYKDTVKLYAYPASGYEFVGWYTGQSSGTLLSTDTEYTYTLDSDSTQTIYGRFMKTHSTSIYVSPRANWGDNYYVRLYQSGGSNVHSGDNGFVKANYDSTTGYYKATFKTTKTGMFWALIAKDTNHTDKVPSDGGYTGTLGTSYIFKHDQSASALTQYSSQRCIWFIDDTTNHFIGNDGAKMRIDNWSNTYDMRSIGNYCYVYEYTTGTDFSNASGITFKRTDSNNNQWNYWNTTPTSGKSQYTATGSGNNSGSWTN